MQARSRPTIRDVARAAEVSVGTVSRGLNRHASVRPAIRQRVEAAIEALGYAPNVVARSMRSRTTHTIGCVIRDITLPALAAFVQAAHDVLHDAGYALMLTNSEGRRDREFELLTLLNRRQTDGLMIAQYSEHDDELTELLRRSAIPMVLFDRELPDWSDGVMVDHRYGTRRATEHLLRLGHRRIALLTGAPSLFPARDRLKGYEEAHARWGVPIDPQFVCIESFLPNYGFQRTSTLLTSSNPPTALIAGGIDMLPGVLRAVRVHGLKIPGDVSVVGSSETDLAELATPAISIERWDLGEVGRIAATLLLERLHGRAGPEPRRVLMPSEFLNRDSCAPPPPADRRPAVPA